VRSRDRGIGSWGGAEREGQSKRNLIEKMKMKMKRKEDKYDQEESEERNKDSQVFVWCIFQP